MVRIWTLIPAALAAAMGCTALPQPMGAPPQPSPIDTLTNSVQKMFEVEDKTPASEFACAFANRLQRLPDQSRGGQENMGIVGEIFLYCNRDNKLMPAVPLGELTIYVTDATERNGAAPAKPEAWHFTSDVLKKKRLIDDRYGRSIAVFLPWPAAWRDVNRLSIQARYDQPGGITLFAQSTTLTLDLANTNGASAGGSVTTMSNLGAIPDPRMALAQMQQNQRQPVTGVVQAGAWSPQMPQQQQMPQMAPPGTWVMPQQQQMPQMAPPGAWPMPQQQPVMQQQMPQMAPPGGWAMPGQQPVPQQQAPMAWGSPVQQPMPLPDMPPPQSDPRFVIPRH